MSISKLVAISKALCFVEVSSDIFHIILSDSLSNERHLYTRADPRKSRIHDILARLISLERAGKRVQFCWVPCHVNIAGNEASDVHGRLRLPAQDFFIPRPAPLSCPSGSGRGTQREQQTLGTETQSEALSTELAKNRRQEVTLCRLLIGHTYATHGYLRG